MIDRLLTTPCVIGNVAGSTTDDEGNVTPVRTSTATVCHMQPYRPSRQTTTDDGGAGEPTTERRWRIWWPDGTVVTQDATVTADGLTLAVEGLPETRRAPRGTTAYVSALLREVS